MDKNSKSPEPRPGSPPQNTSTPARRDFYDSVSEQSDESIVDEGSVEHSEDDLDEYLKNAEGLSDQTMGDMRLYDCSLSLSTDAGKSLTFGNHTLSNRRFHDLSCSMLADCEKSVPTGTLEEISPHRCEHDLEIQILQSELQKAQEEIKTLTCQVENEKRTNEILAIEVKDASQYTNSLLNRTKRNVSKICPVNESYDIANLSICSLEHTRNGNPPIEGSYPFHISSYVKEVENENQNASNSNNNQENKSIQTSPTPPQLETKENNVNLNEDINDQAYDDEMCDGELSVIQLKFNKLHALFKSYSVYSRIPKQEIDSAIEEIHSTHENKLIDLDQHHLNHQKHLQESLNGVKDELKTMKMRYQEAMKYKDKIREMKAHRSDVDGDSENGENSHDENLEDGRVKLDDSFGSTTHSNNEEVFSNLSRIDKSILKLTHLEYMNDEVVEAVHIPESCRQLLEDKDLKYMDLEKKFEANKRYLEEQTHDRELEREEFQQLTDSMQFQIEELRKDNAKLLEENKQAVYQIEDLTTRLSNSEENGLELTQRLEKTQNELQSSLDKVTRTQNSVYELRVIVRENETQIDYLNQKMIEIEEQKRTLRDELEKKEILITKEQPIYKEQDTYGTIALDVTEEIHHQIQDITRKIELKLLDMDIVTLSHTRPNSSCSGVASAVSTEDISCRDIVGRNTREHFPVEHMRSAIFNEIHRLEEQLENLLRYDDMIIKKLKDAELQTVGQKTKIQELESQISSYQEKCASQSLKIADLEGKIDTLRFESSNQSLITSLQTRLGTASKQIDELRIILTDREKELNKVKTDYNQMKAHQLEKKVVRKDACSQTSVKFEETLSYAENTFEGVSPEKIRRMDTANPLNTSILSLSRTVVKDGQSVGFEPEPSILESFHEQGRSGKGGSLGGGDSSNCADESSPGDITIKEMDDNLLQLQQLLQEKDKEIQNLNRKLVAAEKAKDSLLQVAVKRSSDDKTEKKSDKCEHESVLLETDLNPDQQARNDSSATRKDVFIGPNVGSDGDSSNYEISYSHDYQVDGDLLKYLGTKLLYQGPKMENLLSQGERRIHDTDQQIEIATLNTHIMQIKRALEEEKRKSHDLTKRLKLCEDEKAASRSRSPMTRAPVQNVVSAVSVHQLQQQELARQVEGGRKLLKEKEKEIRSLKSQILDLETKLTGKDTQEKELLTRLTNTIVMLKRCEEHGRDLTTNNQEQVHEIRRLRSQLDRANVNRNNENYPQSQGVKRKALHKVTGNNGSEYFENFMRAKSHRKALAWQKKYLSSVVLGYKSILRQNGHGSEHPDLLQTHVPIAPSAVGYLDTGSPKTRFRVGVLTVIATVRMKFMVSRWCKKRHGETSPDSEYKASKPISRADLCIIRPRKTIIVHNRVSAAHPPPLVDSNVNRHESRRGNLEDISQYLSRFASLENEISSSLSRNIPPSK